MWEPKVTQHDNNGQNFPQSSLQHHNSNIAFVWLTPIYPTDSDVQTNRAHSRSNHNHAHIPDQHRHSQEPTVSNPVPSIPQYNKFANLASFTGSTTKTLTDTALITLHQLESRIAPKRHAYRNLITNTKAGAFIIGNRICIWPKGSQPSTGPFFFEGEPASVSPLPQNLNVRLGWVGRLDLVVEPVELILDAVLRGGVKHLGTDAGCRRGPGVTAD